VKPSSLRFREDSCNDASKGCFHSRLFIFFSASRFGWAIPESFAFNKSVFTISFYVSEIFLVRISMNRNKEIQFFTAPKLFTHPTTLQAFVLSALPDFTEGRTAPVPAAFLQRNFTIAPRTL
jgi:hypothetical protein